jgi:hypothetical protein
MTRAVGLGKESGRASHDAHISKSRYGAPAYWELRSVKDDSEIQSNAKYKDRKLVGGGGFACGFEVFS